MKLRALFAAGLLVLASTTAWADFARVGPANVPSPPGNGFPKWYQDMNGLVLDFCLPDATDTGAQTTACLLTGGPTYVFPSTFPDEAFYFRATSLLDTGGGKRAVLVLALEGAFANGAAAPGDQMVFARIRITAGVPNIGTYTVIHPWGEDKFIVDAVGAGTVNRDIVFTEDVGVTPGAFNLALKGRAGPFLLPASGTLTTIGGVQFLSDGVAPIAVTGSRFGTNTFTMCGPFTAPGVDTCIVQPLFTLTGRVHNLVTDPIASPLAIERATYSRSGTATSIDVSASAIAGIGAAAAKLSVAAADVPPVLMRGPSVLGTFYGQGIPVPPTSVPGIVSVINSGDNPPALVTRNLVDEVSIVSAVYDPATNTLTVVATTSDKGISGGDSPPALQLDGFPAADVVAVRPAPTSDAASVLFTVSNVVVPPAAVDVVSSVGGVGRLDITMLPGPAFPPGVPLAKDDIAPDATAGGPAVVIQVKANDVAPADPLASITAGPVTILAPGISPAGFGALTANADGTVSFLPGALSGAGTFKYTVANNVGTSNPATVTVNVLPGAAGPTPIANPDSAQVFNGGSVNIPVLSNDSANLGTIDVASVLISQLPAVGTAVANAAGVVTYSVPGGSPLGPQTFEYTVANTNGNRSAPATVTVNIIPAETVTVGTARCTGGKWDVRGTASASTSITLYRSGNATGTVLATLPVDATGAWRLTQNSACVSPISARTSAGTVRNQIIVTIK
ncbi:MAG: Ig-like domain-containing protein [Burkholderiaceae bacterium]